MILSGEQIARARQWRHFDVIHILRHVLSVLLDFVADGIQFR